MPTEDKRRGKQLPTPVTPPTTVCFTITVPNAVQYRAALLGQLNILGEWHTWDHPIDGTNCADCEEAAQLWRNAIAGAVFTGDCEAEPMSCDDVADCIETSEAVQEAIAQQIANNPSNQTTVYETSVYGAPLTAAQRTAPSATPPDCDLDVLFAMCTAIIDQIHTNNQDFLEILEAASNPTERARNVISAIPVVGLLPIDEAIEFIDQLVEEIQENYDAQWTTSIRDELRCALFCKAKEATDCIITFDMIVSIFEDRLNYYLDPAAVAAALVQYFLLSTWAGSTVVDIMSLIQVAFWREASNWLGVNIRTLQIVARLVIDNPDPDWEILCTDCATITSPLTIFAPAGYPGGTFVQLNETTVRFTSALGGDTVHRVAFQYDNDAPRCVRMAWSLVSGSLTPGYSGSYACGSNPAANGYTDGLTVQNPPVQDECLAGYVFGSISGPYVIDITFTEDC
jgi:hypothetical protein